MIARLLLALTVVCQLTFSAFATDANLHSISEPSASSARAEPRSTQTIRCYMNPYFQKRFEDSNWWSDTDVNVEFESTDGTTQIFAEIKYSTNDGASWTSASRGSLKVGDSISASIPKGAIVGVWGNSSDGISSYVEFTLRLSQ